ncbi:oxidoreductase [Fusarium oxysporum f. sp. radicis-lycopersici 26381]|nr:oxidoreductase [Fusarium oxysporum f. sp. radicis-lycopersici 26381]
MVSQYDATATASGLAENFDSEIKGKVVLTTGVSPGGIGSAFVEAVTKGEPALMILATRNVTKAAQVAQAIESVNANVKTRVLELDLSSFSAVRKAAETLLSWSDVPSIDVLVNNAAIIAWEYTKTVDGYESQFGTNYLGHFLFTNLTMEKLLASSSPRIVNVSSEGHRLGPIRFFDYNFHDGETYNGFAAYGQAKTANILFSLSLAEKLGKRGLLSFSLHPGIVAATNIGVGVDWQAQFAALLAYHRQLGNKDGWMALTDFTWKSHDQGAATHVYAAFEPTLKENNGAYLEDSGIANAWEGRVAPWATSSIEAARLWKLSEELVGQEFQY